MTDTTTHASAAPTTPDSTPVEWHTADADDRWPGRWTAHTASVHAHGRTYLIRGEVAAENDKHRRRLFSLEADVEAFRRLIGTAPAEVTS